MSHFCIMPPQLGPDELFWNILWIKGIVCDSGILEYSLDKRYSAETYLVTCWNKSAFRTRPRSQPTVQCWPTIKKLPWCALPFSPSAGLKRQPEHFLSNGSGEALRLAESSHG